MEERNYRKSIKHLKTLPLFWLWMPIIYCLLLSFGYIALDIILPDEMGSAVVGLIFVTFYATVVAPLMSISYCKRIRNMGWTKYLCCIYNAIMMGSYFTIYWIPTHYFGRELAEIIFWTMVSMVSSVSLFVLLPALICGLITLIVYDVKRRKTDAGSLS